MAAITNPAPRVESRLREQSLSAAAMTCSPVRSGSMRAADASVRPVIAITDLVAARGIPQGNPLECIPARLAMDGQRDVADAPRWQPGRIAPR
ncbi:MULTISPECIES: hypothetical protein [Pseudoxanthomonas]|uniref:hypothetical protein n=1 Tax=Pseudoxanthomonas TaxID=83618 RepID=UPI00177FF92E|nr:MULTISPECIES: hypothetical protein [Pseudoxanthomonas]MBD9377411.1 hypothetical protein [Pseudoxanthomonas sp. PXM04]